MHNMRLTYMLINTVIRRPTAAETSGRRGAPSTVVSVSLVQAALGRDVVRPSAAALARRSGTRRPLGHKT